MDSTESTPLLKDSQRETSRNDDDEQEIAFLPKRKWKWFWSSIAIQPLMFCVMLGNGLSSSVIVNFVMDRSCVMHFHFNASICNSLDDSEEKNTELEELIQPYASLIITQMSLISSIIPVLLSLFLGAWSDENGRKLLLVSPTIGYSLKFFMLAIFSQIPELHPMVLLLSEVPVALSGGLTNFLTAAFAYICDTSKENECSIRIGIMEAFMLCGSIIGSLSSAPLYRALESHHYPIIFGISGGVTLVSAVLTQVLVPESVGSVEGGKGICHIFDLNLLRDMMRVCVKRRENYKRSVIFLVISSLSITVCTKAGESNINFLFTRLKFHWNIEEYSKWVATRDGIIFLGFPLGTYLIKKCIRVSDVALGMMAFATLALSDLYVALVPSNQSNLMFYIGLIEIFSGFCGPSGRSIISKCVAKEELGKVFALTSSCECLLALAAAPLYTLIYNYTLNTKPETIFLVGTGLYLINISFYTIVYIIQRRFRDNDEDIIGDEVTE